MKRIDRSANTVLSILLAVCVLFAASVAVAADFNPQPEPPGKTKGVDRGKTKAGIAIEERPLSLVTKNLATHGGQPHVLLSDLALALGGSGQFDKAKNAYRITTGAGGVLKANSAALRGGPPVPKKINATTVVLSIGGQDVTIDYWEVIMLRPAEPAMPLSALAKLFGGAAKMNSDGTWKIPPGDPSSPLAFR